MRTTAADGKNYKVSYYNLEVILSVGRRVKSTAGVTFGQWATRLLKEHLMQQGRSAEQQQFTRVLEEAV